MARAPRWMRSRVGVRAASALSAAAVVAVALLVAGAALVFLVGQSLRGTVVDTARQEANQIADRTAGNYERSPNKNAFEAVDSLTRHSDLAQVLVDYTGDSDTLEVTVEGSTDAAPSTPMSDLRPADGESIVVPDARITRSDGVVVDAVLVARGGDTIGSPVYVYVAEPLTTVANAVDTVLFYLFIGVPLLILVAGLATYRFAGRALRPVEAIRAQVARLTEKDLDTRVPVPAARDEVGRLALTMNAMLTRLQDAQGAQRRFVADASHELRSPLATIAAGLELLESGAADPGTVAVLRVETERVNRLVDALLLLARADERGLRPRRDEVDLDDIAEAERVRPGDGGVPAEVRAAPVRVIGDRGQLVRVVRNLVDNARRHAATRVLVTVRRADGWAVIEVADDGAGVPVADRGAVFERFVRLDDARARSDGGSGLGLAIVSEVVAAHGGTVEVADAPGGGALFRVRLPAAPAAEPPASEPFPAVRPATVPPAAAATPTVPPAAVRPTTTAKATTATGATVPSPPTRPARTPTGQAGSAIR